MIVQFEIHPGKCIHGEPRYLPQEYSLDFFTLDKQLLEERKGTLGTTSFLAETEQLEVGIETGLCLYVWGYCPDAKRIRQQLSLPPSTSGVLKALPSDGLRPGVGIDLRVQLGTTVYESPDSGWICIGEPMGSKEGQCVEFATNTLAVVDHGRLVSLWVLPVSKPDNHIQTRFEASGSA